MCGIAGIITTKGRATPFLLHALELMDNRGYDGFGIGVWGSFPIKKGPKQFEALKKEARKANLAGGTGIAHNRWSTHGVANEANAHPHVAGSITLVHNGTIGNFEQIKKDLQDKGHAFYSETDTEVVAALIDHYRKDLDFLPAVRKALLDLDPTSTYALLIMDSQCPGQIIAACRGSRPLLWSAVDGKTYIASEETALNGYAHSYSELNEGDLALFEAGRLVARENITGDLMVESKKYEIDAAHHVQIKKTADYWMYQEMMDAPDVIRNAIGKRATTDNGIILGGIGHHEIQERLRKTKKFYVAGCGTSYHAAQIIATAIEEIAKIPSGAIVASEYIYRTTVFDPETTTLIVISQSGETADVVRLMKEWKPRGILMLGIVNVPNTQITKLTDAGIYCHIRREIAVASTKAFLGQVICGIMFAISMGQQRGLSAADRTTYIEELLALPEKAETVLAQESYIKSLAKKYARATNFLFMGRKYSAVTASEGALKLKEVTWKDTHGRKKGTGIHASAIQAGEMKHGTLAMIDENFPSFITAPYDSVFAATMNNVSEVRARKGSIILVTNLEASVEAVNDMDLILIPITLEVFSAILAVIPAQMFAFYSAIVRSCNPDKPRNLAKAVTVE